MQDLSKDQLMQIVQQYSITKQKWGWFNLFMVLLSLAMVIGTKALIEYFERIAESMSPGVGFAHLGTIEMTVEALLGIQIIVLLLLFWVTVQFTNTSRKLDALIELLCKSCKTS